jgi:hypothetical protein
MEIEGHMMVTVTENEKAVMMKDSASEVSYQDNNCFLGRIVTWKREKT